MAGTRCHVPSNRRRHLHSFYAGHEGLEYLPEAGHAGQKPPGTLIEAEGRTVAGVGLKLNPPVTPFPGPRAAASHRAADPWFTRCSFSDRRPVGM